MNRKYLIIIIAIYLIITTSKGIFDLLGSDSKLIRREKTLAALKKERDRLLVEKKKTESPLYLEKIARDKLGLSKPGEEVIVIPPELLADNTPIVVEDKSPNWQKWLKLFF